MGQIVTQKLIAAHLVSGDLDVGSEICLRIDQTLTQDATGTMLRLELDALGLDRARTEGSVQYVDHPEGGLIRAGARLRSREVLPPTC